MAIGRMYRASVAPGFGSFGNFSLAFLSAAAVVYYLAFRLYHRLFFLFGSLAWVVNAVYIFLEETPTTGGSFLKYVVPDTPTVEHFAKHVLPYLASLPTGYFLYLASLDLRFNIKRPVDLISHLPGLVGWTILLFLGYAGMDLLRSVDEATAYKLSHKILVTPGVIFNVYVLGTLALQINRMSNQQTLDFVRGATSVGRSRDVVEVDLADVVQSLLRWARKLLFFSFAVYAFLQVIYFFRSELSGTYWWRLPLVIALDCKIVNALAVGLLLLADYEQFAHQFQSRSMAEDLGLLTGTIGHDIRNPLTHIGAKLRNMRLEYSNSTAILNDLAEIKKHLDRIQAAVKSVEETRGGREFYARRSITRNLREVVDAAVKAVKKSRDLSAVRIEFVPGPAVPVHVYQERLVTALVNIINNGVEACQARRGGPSSQVRITCREDRGTGEAVLTVRDNGTGIPRVYWHKIFRPLYTTKQDDNSRQNRGLGLFAAKRIVDFHGGELTFESESESESESEGESYTEMILKLPLARARR
jgi:signal transduction histidine kinase